MISESFSATIVTTIGSFSIPQLLMMSKGGRIMSKFADFWKRLPKGSTIFIAVGAALLILALLIGGVLAGMNLKKCPP